MAHYALLDANNIVINIIVGKDENEGDIDWEAHYSEVTGLTCKRTSYNTTGGVHLLGGEPFRANYAQIGGEYDGAADAFIPVKPFDSWVLNQTTYRWEAPFAAPDDGYPYHWDEDSVNWVQDPLP